MDIIPAVWTSYFAELEPEEMVRTFAEKGWHHLELSDEHARELLARGDTAKTGAKFRKFAQEHGVSFPQGHLKIAADVAPPEQKAFDEIIDELKHWIDLFVAVGVRAAVIHPGGDDFRQQGGDEGKILDLQVHALTILSRHSAGSGMVFCLENLSKPPADTAEHLLAIIAAAPEAEVGICLDTGHLHMAGGDPGEFVRQAGSSLLALHIDDNDGSSDQHLLPYARGTVPWENLMPALREVGYSGLFNFEIGGETRCPLPVRLAKLDYVKDMAAFMLAAGDQ